MVFDVATGQRQLILDGPTVTARRTAAVSLLAARRLAAQPQGPLLIIGAGVQGSAHLQAFAAGLGTREVWVHSRSSASAQKLVEQAQTMGLQARQVSDLAQAARHCPLIVTCTPAQAVVLNEAPHPQAFVCAVGAFTPQMVELAPELCHHFYSMGRSWWTPRMQAMKQVICCRQVSILLHFPLWPKWSSKTGPDLRLQCFSSPAAGVAGIWRPPDWHCANTWQLLINELPALSQQSFGGDFLVISD